MKSELTRSIEGICILFGIFKIQNKHTIQYTMNEYAKVILPKLAFSKELFEKELIKCIGWTNINELEELHTFCLENFGDKFSKIIANAFSTTAA